MVSELVLSKGPTYTVLPLQPKPTGGVQVRKAVESLSLRTEEPFPVAFLFGIGDEGSRGDHSEHSMAIVRVLENSEQVNRKLVTPRTIFLTIPKTIASKVFM
jgi:hypothetical protein